jgi:hypothetical protein
MGRSPIFWRVVGYVFSLSRRSPTRGCKTRHFHALASVATPNLIGWTVQRPRSGERRYTELDWLTVRPPRSGERRYTEHHWVDSETTTLWRASLQRTCMGGLGRSQYLNVAHRKIQVRKPEVWHRRHNSLNPETLALAGSDGAEIPTFLEKKGVGSGTCRAGIGSNATYVWRGSGARGWPKSPREWPV